MKKAALWVLMSALTAVVTGCAWTPQNVKLDPQTTNTKSDMGKGLQVGVKVVDERTDRILGHRSVGAVGAEMSVDEHPEEAFKSAIADSLRAKGFVPVEYSPDLQRNLKVEIREIKFYLSMGFWTGGVHTNVAFKADATNSGKSHEQFYREENERRVVFVPGADDNAKDVNGTLSRALQQFSDDQPLMDFLAQP